eukprot:35930-Chlamydomonas_euryale.AAC.1
MQFWRLREGRAAVGIGGAGGGAAAGLLRRRRRRVGPPSLPSVLCHGLRHRNGLCERGKCGAGGHGAARDGAAVGSMALCPIH